MTPVRSQWACWLILISTTGVLPVFPASCTSDLLTGSLTGAVDAATDVTFDGLRALLLAGNPDSPALEFALDLTETALDESAAHAIDRAVPDDPTYD